MKTVKVPQIHYGFDMEPVVSHVEISSPESDRRTGSMLKRQTVLVGKKVSIVIVCLNQLAYTRQCVRSIVDNTQGVDYELILVDNASTDGTAEYMDHLERSYSGVQVVHNDRNLGFGAGNNRGFKAATGDYVCCLNNDTIVKPGWLTYLLSCLVDHPRTGIVGPVGSRLGVVGGKTFVHIGGTDSDGARDVHYIEGWCFLISKKVLDEVGWFDESFGLAFSEDADLSFRLREKGYGLRVSNNGGVVHFGSVTVKSQREFNVARLTGENNRKLYSRWGPGILGFDFSRILLVRRGALGDVLMCTPIVRELRKKFPGSCIGLATDCPQVLEGNPHVDVVLKEFDPREWSKVYRLDYEKDPLRNAVEVMAEQAGAKCENKRPELVIDRGDRRDSRRLMVNRKWVAFHTGRSWPNREWPMDRWIELAERLLRLGFSILELGDRKTALTGIGLDLRGLGVRRVGAIMEGCELFVGIDSLCAHIAKAVNVPAVVIYGCVDPSTRKNGGIEYPVWLANLKCRGCRNKTRSLYVECPKKRISCVEDITIDMVYRTVLTALRNGRVGSSSREEGVGDGRGKQDKGNGSQMVHGQGA